MEKKDSIIVLSGPLSEDSELSEETSARVKMGVELLSNGIANFIVMNGGPANIGGTRDMQILQCKTMLEYALSLGVQKSKILVQDYSSDTVGEAYFVKEMILTPRGWKNNVIVTNKFHEKRACIIYDFILGPGYKTCFSCIETSMDKNPEALAKEKTSLKTFLDQFGRLKPGDSAAIEEVLYKSHVLYSKIPENERLIFYRK